MKNLAFKKVEIIHAGSASELESKVNKFLLTHDPVLYIQYQCVSRYTSAPDHCAMIIYG